MSRWASLGLLVLLCGAWVLPSNKLYHQALIALLWLPALLALGRRDFCVWLRLPELLLFVALSLWTLVVLLAQGGEDLGRDAKLPVYILLSQLGVLLAARGQWSFEGLLRAAALLGGLGALVSVLYFRWSSPHPQGQRLIAIGLWDTAIMAAHAVGALAVMGVFLFQRPRGALWSVLWLVSGLGYLAFLGFSQTRGVWLALFATLLVMAFVRPRRFSAWAAVTLLAGGLLAALLAPEILLQRGGSYRPELFAGGMRHLGESWLLGLGFNTYEIAVPGTGLVFKHPHNMYLDLAIRLGLPGLLLFALLWGCVAWRGWQNRAEPLGRALLALWVFSSVALLTDGIGLWLKPNADWLITWLPIALSLVLASRQPAGGLNPASSLQERTGK
ncbi:O-antigen ligase domain-containing protein [Pseudomonas sp. L-22-4S-12]|uniref:O-antigen ligase family protein n=1 Tax=Pseudomonas sp. L-22-4S-12 TaxID=2610893 RepID=UPI001324327E|nr:O-antigen ligase family protein [Pseudomonas sp. L-22-4S-12]MWV15372.1 O-antigen ligase domain-containing protein [Pseudomonas sp. L-22-4S-12]